MRGYFYKYSNSSNNAIVTFVKTRTLSENALSGDNFPFKNNGKGGVCVFGCNFTLLFYFVIDFHVHYVFACVQICVSMLVCMSQYIIIRK
jgi:hypothetical protein